MGTEVLLPRHVLAERFGAPHTPFQRRRNFPENGSLKKLTVNRKGTSNRTSSGPEKKRSNGNGAKKAATHNGKTNGGPVVGQVTLLRRGQSLDSLTHKKKGGNPKSKPQPVDDLAILGTARIGPESPELMPKQIRLPRNVYAGSACSLSPSPNSLPLPSFFNKKRQNDSTVNDSATRDLRRLLRLD
jgi:hypothetical protein